MHFAEAMAWSTIVSVLATANLLKPLGTDGREYTPPARFTGKLLR